LAESEFSTDCDPGKALPVKVNRTVPGEAVVRATSYEHDKQGYTTENPEIAKKGADGRLRKFELISEECEKFEMIRIHGNKNSKNLVVGWGSTKGAILDAINGSDYKFLQVVYMSPFSKDIKEEIEKVTQSGGKVILIEQNVSGQLGRLIREKTGINIDKKILKYDSRPFRSDELREELERI